MTKKSRYLYLAVFALHVVIAIVAFLKFWMHPSQVAFCDFGDGLKNQFTLLSYVKEPLTSDGIFKFNSFKYPFGDYVYFTDNTALFSVPFRWFCHYVWDLSNYTIPIFNTVIILNFVLCGLLLFYIFRRLCNENVLAIILSVIFSWTNIQVMRVWRGHFNLSFSSLLLLAILLVMLWHRYQSNVRRQWFVVGFMALLVFFSTLIHGYYSVIVGGFLCASLAAYGVLCRGTPLGHRSFFASVAGPVLGLGAVIVSMMITDPYFGIRPEAAGGYDYFEQKVTFCRLFSHYPFQRFVFPVTLFPLIAEPELAAYLGNVGLYTFSFLVLGSLFFKSFRQEVLTVQRDFFSDKLKKSMFIGGLIMLSIGFGENYYTADVNMDGNRFHLINIFNPFFYLHLVTKRVEQFRSLARMMWPFWFMFNIWMGYTLIQLSKHYGRKMKVGIVLFVLLVGGAELKNYAFYMQGASARPNYLDKEHLAQMHFNPAYADCQAIIPVPFYIVGSEKKMQTLDDQEEWSNFTYRLSLRTHLPLMASKLSRTPRVYDSMLLNMMTTETIDALLSSKLSSKPILVALNKKLVADQSARCVPPEPDRAALYWRCNQFAYTRHLVPVDSCDDVVYYKWYPKN